MSTATVTQSSLPPTAVRAWFLASRPKTLVAGFIPVLVGSALAMHDAAFRADTALAALIGALLIQIGTNLTNDYFDFKKGADTSDRLGPPRATQQGWLSPHAVITGAFVCFALAFLTGLYLVAIAGWPILVVGIISIIAGYAYTGGPFPLGYNGLGDVFVFVFFGLVAVGGTYFVQAQHFSPWSLLAGVPVGLLGCALLAVNNTRDRETDVKAGKRTLVVRFGKRFGQVEYAAAVVLSALVPVVMWSSGHFSPWVMLALASVPLAWQPFRMVLHDSGARLNAALGATARMQLVFGVLFAIGLAQ